jgi:SpoVK/Ycf46/Vps4 family AAA+-type ATPase
MNKQWAAVGSSFTPISDQVSKSISAGYYRPDLTGGMQPQLVITPVNLVTDNLLVLEDFPVEHVVSNIKKFWSKAEQYKRNGLIHKRGIMLEGPPGTGKTSISNLIAKFFIESGGVVFFGGVHNIANGAMGAAIEHFRDIQKNPLLVVIEEFDQIMGKSQWKDLMMQLMDGATQIDNVVYLLSTNFIDRIDQRFTKRPSRIDEIIHVGQPSEKTRKAYLKVMLEMYEGSASEVDEWAKATDGLLLSHLKEAVIAVKILDHPLDTTITRLRAMVPEAKKKNDKNNPWAVAAAMESLSQAAYQMAEASGGTDPEE